MGSVFCALVQKNTEDEIRQHIFSAFTQLQAQVNTITVHLSLFYQHLEVSRVYELLLLLCMKNKELKKIILFYRTNENNSNCVRFSLHSEGRISVW